MTRGSFRLFLLAGLAGLLFPQSPETAEQIVARALSLHRAGDMEGAIRGYREFLKLKPDAAEIRSNLGAALTRQGRYEEAIAEYREAVKAMPAHAGLRLNLALAHYKALQIPEASAELSEVLRLQPGQPQATLLAADCALRTADYAQVVALLAPLESAKENELAVAYLLGSAYIRGNQVTRGQVLIDKILRNGNSAEARLLLGTSKMMVRDYAGALEEMTKAVELNPKLPDVYSYYGMALLQTGDTPGAMKAFRKELETNPNDFEANLNLGALLKQEQRFDEAVYHLKRALSVRPRALPVRYQLSSVELATGNAKAAQEELEAIVREAPDFLEAHVTLATAYYRLGRKPDGDRERQIVQKINAERQAQQPGAKGVAEVKR